MLHATLKAMMLASRSRPSLPSFAAFHQPGCREESTAEEKENNDESQLIDHGHH